MNKLIDVNVLRDTTGVMLDNISVQVEIRYNNITSVKDVVRVSEQKKEKMSPINF